MLSKTEGLTRAQLAQQHPPPSELTLAGLLYHLSLVEDWLEVGFAGLPDRDPWANVDWDADPNWSSALRLSSSRSSCRVAIAKPATGAGTSFQTRQGWIQLSARALRDGRHFSLRWALLHLVEETARHAGHADLLREAVDGTVGE